MVPAVITTGTPETATETLVEWVENGATWYRVTIVGGLVRLETAKNGSTKADRHWVMCVPEGRQAFDALLVGIQKIDRDRGRLRDVVVRLFRAVRVALAVINDQAVADGIMGDLPAMLETMGLR